jgi:hypothetical protein
VSLIGHHDGSQDGSNDPDHDECCGNRSQHAAPTEAQDDERDDDDREID